MIEARPRRPWTVEDRGSKFIIEAPGDGYITRDVCRLDGSTMAAFYQSENAKVIAEAGTVWHETGLTPSQLQARVAELEAALREVVRNHEDPSSNDRPAVVIARSVLKR